jgi:hypothetical protein
MEIHLQIYNDGKRTVDRRLQNKETQSILQSQMVCFRKIGGGKLTLCER